MNTMARLHGVEQQFHELSRFYLILNHRLRDFHDMQMRLDVLRDDVKSTKLEVEKVRSVLRDIQQRMPAVARAEEVQRLVQRLDAMPFETAVTREELYRE